MIKWGINAINHDASLSVFYKDKCVFASHSERFSKVKNDSFLNQSLIDYALQFGNPDEIIWSEKPYLKKFRQLITFDERLFDISPKNHLKQFGIKAPITYINHHESHAAAAAYTSGFDESLVFVFDGIGEFDTISVWKHQGSELKCVHKQKYYNSLGLFYSAFTQLIGLKPNEEEFILMGMSGYGNPIYTNILLKKYFKFEYPNVYLKENLHRGVDFQYFNKFDVASSVQKIYEKITRNICEYFKNIYKINNACFSGGCSLNCLANSKFHKIFDNVWIYPNSGDAGNSYGAVLSTIKKQHKYDPYVGYNIERNIDINKIIEELKKGKIVAVANGKAEFGPRALGNRSLIADPRVHMIQDKVNLLKRREKFRPFAPSILEENFKDIFETPVDRSRYMNFVFKNKYPKDFEGITHIDGTSRVQTVDKDSNTVFRSILLEWKRETSMPLLLNTSLNIKGQPLINNEQDAKEFYIKSNIKVF